MARATRISRARRGPSACTDPLPKRPGRQRRPDRAGRRDPTVITYAGKPHMETVVKKGEKVERDNKDDGSVDGPEGRP